jgi:SAM-dependent methyltransferase
VGAGAGSIAMWLADVVGPAGSVVALDVDPRFLRDGLRPNLTIVQGDICEYDRERAFDLVHARYVLQHVPAAGRALERMASSLRPGGWILVEEPDFLVASFAGGPPELEAPVERVNASIRAMFVSRKMDPRLSVRLPGLLAALDLHVTVVESEGHLVAGGSDLAMMMGASAAQLKDKYVSTGLASAADVDAYLRCAQDPTAWARYFATVRVLARR